MKPLIRLILNATRIFLQQPSSTKQKEFEILRLQPRQSQPHPLIQSPSATSASNGTAASTVSQKPVVLLHYGSTSIPITIMPSMPQVPTAFEVSPGARAEQVLSPPEQERRRKKRHGISPGGVGGVHGVGGVQATETGLDLAQSVSILDKVMEECGIGIVSPVKIPDRTGEEDVEIANDPVIDGAAGGEYKR